MADAEPTKVECNGCKKEREKRHETPRTLYRLPSEITASQLFKNRTLPLYLCTHCDGDNIEDAIRQHDRRLAS